MKKINLERTVDLKSLSIPMAPVYAFESNYCFTSKYSCWQRVIYRASVTILLFSDRIALVPCTREGTGIIDALKKMIDLKDDRRIVSAQSLIVRKYISVSDYVDQITYLLENFEADADFGLYGFFSYELINMKLGMEIPDLPLGIFYLPEVMSVNRDPVFQYSMQGHGGADVKISEPIILSHEGSFDLQKFSKGESGVYEQLYDLSQNNISSRKIKSLNPSFPISKEIKINSYTIYEKLKSQNLAPYNFYISYYGFDVVGSSPAMFIRIKSNFVESSPICGTIARGKTDEEDFSKTKRLLESEKDDYELSQCIRCDMEAKKISCDRVTLVRGKEIEKFTNVFHTSAHITGLLRSDKTIGNVIEDHLWPSTIVGSPVATAARLIAENEVRNWYGGAFGYILMNNKVDFGTMIRCAALYKGVATTRVGSTITKYSKPQLESDELRAKASLILGVL
ncbi:chorismate-binding protein [Burkholderia sp. L27(2015)]|uniref:chorismate-binding protein n=1 Tax=Burkholderia sp. L27(2015) TaxID=1641858 RepID=UPI00131B03FF|nr:chorismate-binding protein [Burkholderia sp. L27(2015)]